MRIPSCQRFLGVVSGLCMMMMMVIITLQVAPSWSFSITTVPRTRLVPISPSSVRSSFPQRPAVSSVSLRWRPTSTPSTRKNNIMTLQGTQKDMSNAKGFFAKLGGDDDMFQLRTTISLVAGQAVLVGLAVIVGALFKTPNFGLGANISFSLSAIGRGILMTIPLGTLAWTLDQIEEYVPALQDVTTATQRSLLALLGSTFKPGLGLFVAIALGVAAGFGEEMLFRGVFQYELVERLGKIGAVGVSSVVFGLLHAVTPMYAFLATLASFYFGYLYLDTGNLAVPIVTHALYDIGALYYAHWTVANLSPKEQTALAEWDGPRAD